jgi:hypothetical protein
MKNNLKKKSILFSTALATSSLVGGYYRRAYGACDQNSPISVLCSGSAVVNNEAILLDIDGVEVTTSAGFGIRVEEGTALEITGEGDLSFIDNHSSKIISADINYDGIYISSLGGGSITIVSNSNITSASGGIDAEVDDAEGGLTSISFNGNILSGGDGIVLDMDYGFGNAVISTSASSSIKSGADAIDLNLGEEFVGSLEINHRGYVSALDGGIELDLRDDDQDVVINTYAGSVIKSVNDGINLENNGSGSMTLNLNGKIDASSGNGVYVESDEYTNSLSITTGSNSVINAGNHGIQITVDNGPNDTDFDISIGGTINAGENGIEILDEYVAGAEFDITTNAGSTINASGIGINFAFTNSTLDRTSITVDGNINSGGEGVKFDSDINNLEISVAGEINSQSAAVHIRNNNDQASVEIDITGDLNSKSSGLEINGSFDTINIAVSGGKIKADIHSAIFVGASTQNETNITLEEGASVIGFEAIYNDNSGDFNIVLNGTSKAVTVSGTSGNAIASLFGDTSILISGDVNLDGDVLFGALKDNSLVLVDANLTTTKYTDFKNLDIAEFVGNNRVNGNLNINESDIEIEEDSSLIISGSLTAGELGVFQGATFSANYANVSDASFDDNSTLKVISGNSGIGKLIVEDDINIEEGVTIHISSTNFSSGSGVIIEAGGEINGSFANVVNGDKYGASLVYNNGNPKAFSLVNFNSGALNSQVQSSLNSSILFSDSLTSQLADSALANGEKNFWFKTLYRGQDSETSATELGVENKSYGFALGGETSVGNSDYKLGFSLGEVSSRSDLVEQKGSRDSNSFFGSIYGIYGKELTSNLKFFSSLSLGFGYHENDNKRLVTNEQISSYATSRSDDTELNATLQAGLKTNLGKGFYITPKASVSYIETHAGEVSEINGGNAQVTLDKNVYKNLKTREAVRFGHDNSLNLGGVAISPYLELGLSQEKSLGNRSVTGKFFNGSKFDVTLANSDRNFVTSAIGVNLQVTPSITAFVNLESAKSSEEERKDAKAGLMIKF